MEVAAGEETTARRRSSSTNGGESSDSCFQLAALPKGVDRRHRSGCGTTPRSRHPRANAEGSGVSLQGNWTQAEQGEWWPVLTSKRSGQTEPAPRRPEDTEVNRRWNEA